MSSGNEMYYAVSIEFYVMYLVTTKRKATDDPFIYDIRIYVHIISLIIKRQKIVSNGSSYNCLTLQLVARNHEINHKTNTRANNHAL